MCPEVSLHSAKLQQLAVTLFTMLIVCCVTPSLTPYIQDRSLMR